MPGVVGRELAGGVVLDAQQVADRVAIFDPVEPADRDAAGVGVDRVDPEGAELDPMLQDEPLLGGRPGLVSRRHDAGSHVPQDAQPEVAIAQASRVGLQVAEIHPALLDPVGVAAEAVRLEDRLDLLVELFRDPVGRRGDPRSRHQDQGQEGKHRPGRSTPRMDDPGREIGHGADPFFGFQIRAVARQESHESYDRPRRVVTVAGRPPADRKGLGSHVHQIRAANVRGKSWKSYSIPGLVARTSVPDFSPSNESSRDQRIARTATGRLVRRSDRPIQPASAYLRRQQGHSLPLPFTSAWKAVGCGSVMIARNARGARWA